MVLTNKAKLGIDSNYSIPNVKQKCETIKILLLYVKAFFVQYILKPYCWYETYNEVGCANMIVTYTLFDLKEFIEHENQLVRNAAG
jgi:hypothetical protein